MKHLRNLSDRPELIIDPVRGRRVIGDAAFQLGIDAPRLGRMVTALPPNKNGPVQLRAPMAIADGDGTLLADAGGNLVGESNALWVHRMLTATLTPDTRRL